MTTKPHRFVPVGIASLSADAPGWEGDQGHGKIEELTTDSSELGPVCWKCKGTGRRKLNSTNHATCSVCQGAGRLLSKQRERESKNRPGEITQPRRNYKGWKDFGPLPHAVWIGDDNPDIVPWRQAQETKQSVQVSQEKQRSDSVWLPKNGEQLCNLVGNWRILQCVGSHRWTTDDLVTAFVAAKQVENDSFLKSESFHYLDLGSGNGSVLSMAAWKLCQILHTKGSKSLNCVAIEARSEAVALNRRSVTFNMGYSREEGRTQDGTCPIYAKVLHGDFRQLDKVLKDDNRFHLVTGTPPYFAVDFRVAPSEDVVQAAVIHQGGMPTCRQSAPARAEFRGGVEAYCRAAAQAMTNDGIFVMCENWINDARVHDGAREAGLIITDILPIKGSTSKPTPLFAVYTMRKREFMECLGIDEQSVPEVADALPVRDGQGKWTIKYAEDVLEWMSIPARHETSATHCHD